MSKLTDQALALHKEHHGKIEMHSKVPLQKAKDLTLAYSPGVAAPCLEIKKDYNKIYDYTNKGNMVAVVTNGTAVLGLGDIGDLKNMLSIDGITSSVAGAAKLTPSSAERAQ
mgnify:CR=1 FL=1